MLNCRQTQSQTRISENIYREKLKENKMILIIIQETLQEITSEKCKRQIHSKELSAGDSCCLCKDIEITPQFFILFSQMTISCEQISTRIDEISCHPVNICED